MFGIFVRLAGMADRSGPVDDGRPALRLGNASALDHKGGLAIVIGAGLPLDQWRDISFGFGVQPRESSKTSIPILGSLYSCGSVAQIM